MLWAAAQSARRSAVLRLRLTDRRHTYGPGPLRRDAGGAYHHL
jgi:hypothetical protein